MHNAKEYDKFRDIISVNTVKKPYLCSIDNKMPLPKSFFKKITSYLTFYAKINF